MNADLLVQQALDSLKRSENEKAVALLKRAAGLAPMRTDIRDLLLVALERRGASPQRQTSAEPSARIERPAAPPEPAPPYPSRRPASPASPAPPEPAIPAPGPRLGSGLAGRDARPTAAQAPGGDDTISLRGQGPQPVGPRRLPRGGATPVSPIGRGLPPPSSRVPMAVLATLAVLCLLGVGAYVLVSYLSAHGIGIGAATTATPTPVPDPLAARRNDLLKEADTLAQVNKYDEADVKLTEALGTNPSDPEREAIQGKIGEFRSQQGTKYLEQRKYTEAAQMFAKAVEADPKSAEWQFWLGRARLLKGSGETRPLAKADFLLAKTALEKAIEMDENLLRAYQALAQTNVKLNDPVAAKTYYWQIIQRAPDSPEAASAIRDLKEMRMQIPPRASTSASPKTPAPRNP